MGTIVVSGTDTGVGKSVFAAGLVRFLDGTYWKPIQSGLEGPTDSEIVRHLSGLRRDRVVREAWRLRAPLSPHRAAELDGKTIDPAQLDPPAGPRTVIVEGAGGLMVPLDRRTLWIDVFARWNAPLVLCARTSLGTINHTLLSLEALRRRDVPLLGTVFIGEANEDNQRTVAEMSGVPVIGRLPWLRPLTSESLAAAFAASFRREDFLRG